METKHLSHVELKLNETPGSFDGVLSAYGIKDGVGDICVAGCFDETVKAKGAVRPLLWNHSHSDPIGTIQITDTKDNLTVAGSINMDVQRGREAYALLKRGDISGMSIGYIAEDFKYDKDGIRRLSKVDLWEGSLVTFPANPKAVAHAKAMEKEKMSKEEEDQKKDEEEEKTEDEEDGEEKKAIDALSKTLRGKA